MDVITMLVVNPELTEAVDPDDDPFTYPSMVTEAFAGLDAASSDPWGDASLAQSHPTASEVVALVSMQLDRTLAWPTSGSLDRSDGIHHLFEHHAVVDIRRRVPDRVWDAVPVDHNVALRARFAAIRWIRAGFGPSLEQAHSLSPAMPEASVSARPCPIDPEGYRAGLCQPFASPEAVANKSHRSPPPSPGAISPRECRFSGRTLCPLEPPGREPGGRALFSFGDSGGNNGSVISHRSSLATGFFIPPSIAPPFTIIKVLKGALRHLSSASVGQSAGSHGL